MVREGVRSRRDELAAGERNCMQDIPVRHRVTPLPLVQGVRRDVLLRLHVDVRPQLLCHIRVKFFFADQTAECCEALLPPVHGHYEVRRI